MKNLKVKKIIDNIVRFKNEYPVTTIYVVGNFLI